MYTGEPYPGVTPYVFMRSEPHLQVTPVIASKDYMEFVFSEEQIRRSVRLYMPRTLNALLENYDVIIISDSNVASFTTNHLLWFKASVEEGLGLVMVGGHETFGAIASHPDWGQTPVGEVLPVETLHGHIGTGKVTIESWENPFIQSLPWRQDLPFLSWYTCNIVKPKAGSETLAIDSILSGDDQGWDNPFFCTWDLGRGRTFAFTGDWQYGWGVEFIRWNYAPDFVINLMLYLSKKPLPEDLTLVHTVRALMATLEYRRSLLDALIAFVERFGASSSGIEQATRLADQGRRHVSEHYLRGEYDEALQAVREALDLINAAENVAERAKDRALLWIHLSEWLVITSASLICGLAVWTLMIRRRLYREVGVTRFK